MNEPTKMEDRQIEESILKPPSDLERVLSAVDTAAENMPGPGRLVLSGLALSLSNELAQKRIAEEPPVPTQEPPKRSVPPKRPFIERLLKSVGF